MSGKHARNQKTDPANAGESTSCERHNRPKAVAAALVLAAVCALAAPATREALFSLLSRQETASAQPAAEEQAGEKDAGAEVDKSAADPKENPAAADGEDKTPLETGAAASMATVTSDAGITSCAPEGFVDTPTYQNLESAVATFRASGYDMGFALVDLSTGRSISYQADKLFYPASSCKALYCTAVLETTGGSAASTSGETIQSCIVNSDNDAFRSLLKTYGYRTWGNWLSSYAPESAREAYTYNYPHMSANGMLGCWKEIYRFGTSGEAGSDLLTSCLAQSNHSAWGGLLRDRYTVWSKPGWYPANEGLASTATADNGIVFSDCGDYAVAVLTDAPSDFDALMPVLDALNAAHGKMCGGSSKLVLASQGEGAAA